MGKTKWIYIYRGIKRESILNEFWNALFFKPGFDSKRHILYNEQVRYIIIVKQGESPSEGRSSAERLRGINR